MIRDEKSNAILNNDHKELNKYKLEKQKNIRLKKLESDIELLKTIILDLQRKVYGENDNTD
jgi:hypothetical protein